MINYTTEKEKRLKTAKNAFSRRNKKDRQRRGEASGQNQLKSNKKKQTQVAVAAAGLEPASTWL